MNNVAPPHGLDQMQKSPSASVSDEIVQESCRLRFSVVI